LSEALPQSVAVKAGSKAKAGIANPGYWGIDVRPQTYTGTFWVLGAYKGDFTAALESEAGEILASASVASRSQDGEWTKHEFKLHPTTDRGSSNNFALTFEPEEEGQVLNFNLISLFPPTYKNRPNGMRIELMEALKEMNPSFMRFPGGNNLQGHKAGSRWKWNETIGDLIDRPGRTGAWGYFNTDGLGLIEYMHVSLRHKSRASQTS
jgi:alpha-N-arabinofuranosidase